jgi:twitching motility two-component system response regulator PilH
MQKLLMVDDSIFQRSVLKRMVSQYDLNIEEAENGREGLEKLSGDNYDLIILDMLMPDVNGIDFLKEKNKQKDATPVVVITADIQESVEQECYSLGVSHFLNKPPKKEDVLNAVKSILKLN